MILCLHKEIDMEEREKLTSEVLEILLRDRTTWKNIIWATDEYSALGKGYSPTDEVHLSDITGFTDKNGNKIFEGDIVYNGVFKAQIEFINGHFSPFGGDTFFADECEVIGNIHDQNIGKI